MKKIFLLWGITAIWVLFLSLLLHSFTSRGNSGLTAVIVGFIQDFPLFLGLFIWNRRIGHQKILMKHYSLIKMLALLFPVVLYLGIMIFLLITHPVSSMNFGLNLFAIIIVASCEEFIFRGLILGGLVSSGKSLSFSVIVSSVLFGGIHIVNLGHQNLYNTGLQMLYASALGGLFAVLYLKSNNLIVPIILHFFIDFANSFITNGTMNSTAATPKSVFELYIIIAIIIVPFALTGKEQFSLFKKRLTNIS
ncbi:MAG: CPBP family intramembrane metalloprotease [Streptococcaceae bacterium]|jgi:membrane protease YdiL (CAAX protease family)|nr:CPBP family intramembrane metalloprotease [Streptococcaceae bacterium]